MLNIIIVWATTFLFSVSSFDGFNFLISTRTTYFVSNIIYDIEIVHTNKELRTLLYKELEEQGIKKGSVKKNFSELEKIKEQIINEKIFNCTLLFNNSFIFSPKFYCFNASQNQDFFLH